MDKSTKLSEHQLTRVKRGDERAFRELYNALHQSMYAFSLRFTHSSDDAKEVVQNVFLRLWKYRSRIDPSQPIEPYLYQITKHENLKFLRQAARQATLREHAPPLPASRAGGEDGLILAEYLCTAEQAMATLPPKRRLVFQMAMQEERSIQEIAAEMEVNAQTVRTQLTRAVQTVKQYLKRHTDIGVSIALWLITKVW